MTSSTYNVSSGIIAGSLELIDEYARGWAIHALDGELKLQKYAGASSSRNRAKYVGGDIQITNAFGGGLLEIVDPESTLDIPDHGTPLLDVFDRYGAPVHTDCIVDQVDSSTVRLSSQIRCLRSTDHFTHANTIPRVRAGAATNGADGVQLPGTVCWIFGPLLAGVHYAVHIRARSATYAAADTASRAARVTCTANDSSDAFASNVDQVNLVWAQDGNTSTSVASFDIVSSTEVRSRVLLAIHLPPGFETTTFTFEVVGAGERFYIPSGALARAMGPSADDAFTIATNIGTDLIVEAEGHGIEPRGGFREARPATPVIGASSPIFALAPCLIAKSGDKMLRRRNVSYVQSITSRDTTMLDYRQSVSPVGEILGLAEKGTAVMCSTPASIAIPTSRVPTGARPASQRSHKGHFSLTPKEGTVRITIHSDVALANYDIAILVLLHGDVLMPSNASATLLETLQGVQAGDHVLNTRIDEMGNVSALVLRIESSTVSSVVTLKVYINGYSLLGPVEQIVSMPAEFDSTCNLTGNISTSMLQAGGMRMFEYEGNLHATQIRANALRTGGAVSSSENTVIGNVAIHSKANGALHVEASAHVESSNLHLSAMHALSTQHGDKQLLLLGPDKSLAMGSSSEIRVRDTATRFVESDKVTTRENPRFTFTDSATVATDFSSVYKWETDENWGAAASSFLADASNNDYGQAWQAFNKTAINNADCWHSNTGLDFEWLEIKYPYAVSVFSYTVTSRANGLGIYRWNLQGSNDRNTWIDLEETRTASSWGSSQTRSYTDNINNEQVDFLYYRLYIQKTSAYVAVGDWSLFTRHARTQASLLMGNSVLFRGSELTLLDSNQTISFLSSFTGAHICEPAPGWRGSYLMKGALGLLVSSSGVHTTPRETRAFQAVPRVQITCARKDKAVFGVVAASLHMGGSIPQTGEGVVQMQHVARDDMPRVIVASVGEGAVWVLNTNGDVKNGNLLQSSSHMGFAEAQDDSDNIYRTYTLGKSTTNAQWHGQQHPLTPKGFKSAFIGVAFTCG